MQTEEKKELENHLCALKQLFTKCTLSKKEKCCKSFKDGKRCKRCPKK